MAIGHLGFTSRKAKSLVYYLSSRSEVILHLKKIEEKNTYWSDFFHRLMWATLINRIEIKNKACHRELKFPKNLQSVKIFQLSSLPFPPLLIHFYFFPHIHSLLVFIFLFSYSFHSRKLYVQSLSCQGSS